MGGVSAKEERNEHFEEIEDEDYACNTLHEGNVNKNVDMCEEVDEEEEEGRKEPAKIFRGNIRNSLYSLFGWEKNEKERVDDDKEEENQEEGGIEEEEEEENAVEGGIEEEEGEEEEEEEEEEENAVEGGIEEEEEEEENAMEGGIEGEEEENKEEETVKELVEKKLKEEKHCKKEVNNVLGYIYSFFGKFKNCNNNKNTCIVGNSYTNMNNLDFQGGLIGEGDISFLEVPKENIRNVLANENYCELNDMTNIMHNSLLYENQYNDCSEYYCNNCQMNNVDETVFNNVVSVQNNDKQNNSESNIIEYGERQEDNDNLQFENRIKKEEKGFSLSRYFKFENSFLFFNKGDTNRIIDEEKEVQGQWKKEDICGQVYNFCGEEIKNEKDVKERYSNNCYSDHNSIISKKFEGKNTNEKSYEDKIDKKNTMRNRKRKRNEEEDERKTSARIYLKITKKNENVKDKDIINTCKKEIRCNATLIKKSNNDYKTYKTKKFREDVCTKVKEELEENGKEKRRVNKKRKYNNDINCQSLNFSCTRKKFKLFNFFKLQEKKESIITNEKRSLHETENNTNRTFMNSDNIFVNTNECLTDDNIHKGKACFLKGMKLKYGAKQDCRNYNDAYPVTNKIKLNKEVQNFSDSQKMILGKNSEEVRMCEESDKNCKSFAFINNNVNENTNTNSLCAIKNSCYVLNNNNNNDDNNNNVNMDSYTSNATFTCKCSNINRSSSSFTNLLSSMTTSCTDRPIHEEVSNFNNCYNTSFYNIDSAGVFKDINDICANSSKNLLEKQKHFLRNSKSDYLCSSLSSLPSLKSSNECILKDMKEESETLCSVQDQQHSNNKQLFEEKRKPKFLREKESQRKIAKEDNNYLISFLQNNKIPSNNVNFSCRRRSMQQFGRHSFTSLIRKEKEKEEDQEKEMNFYDKHTFNVPTTTKEHIRENIKSKANLTFLNDVEAIIKCVYDKREKEREAGGKDICIKRSSCANIKGASKHIERIRKLCSANFCEIN